MTTLHDFGSGLGRPLDNSLGSYNFMVTALGSCVKWPLDSSFHHPIIDLCCECGLGENLAMYIYIYIYITLNTLNVHCTHKSCCLNWLKFQ